MRVLFLISIFSLICFTQSYSIEIKGDIPESLKKKIEQYLPTISKDKLNDLLSSLGYYIVSENEDEIVINRSMVIKSISFRGNFNVLDSQLLNVSGISLGDYWYLDTFYKLRENLIDFYRNSGFLDAEIEVNFDDGNLLVNINEGERYYLDEFDIVIEDRVINKKIPVRPYSEKSLEKEISDTLNILRKEHYLASKILRFDLFQKGFKRFYLSDDPLSSILSLFKSGIVIKPTVYIAKGEQFSIEVIGDLPSDNITNNIKNLFLENFSSFDTFYLKELELKLTDHLINEGFITPEVTIEVDGNKVYINVEYESFIKSYNVEIYLNDRKVNELNNEYLKSLIISCQDSEAKDYLINRLKSEGYDSASIKNYSIKHSSDNVQGEIVIDPGNFKYIKNIYVNEKLFKPRNQYKISQNELDLLRKEIIDHFSEKCLIKGLTLQKVEKENVYYTMNCSKPSITTILSNHEEIVGKIQKRFFSDDKTLTTSKLEQLNDYILRNKNSEKVYIEPFEIDNKTILLINRLKAKENRIYGSFSYDSVDKLSAELGYNRFDILNSGRTFQISGKKSFLETSVITSLSGQKTLYRYIDDYYALSFKDRDEYDFRYRESLFSSLIRINYENIQTIIGFGISSLDIYDTDFSDYYNKIYENSYNLLTIPFKISYKTKNYESFTGYGLSGTLSATPTFSEKGDFFESRGKIEGYKEIISKDFILKLALEAHHLQGKKEDIPITHLLTLGGPQRMKAFNYREIGFKDPQTSATIGNRSLIYSNLFFGYKPIEQVIIGPFFEFAGYGDYLNNLNYVKDLGLEVIISQQNVGYFSASFGYAPFKPYRGSNAFYINFGINF